MNNNISDSLMPTEIEFSTKTIHRWFEIDGNNNETQGVPLSPIYEEEEEEIELGFDLRLNADVPVEIFEELILSKLSSHLPNIDWEQVHAEFRDIEINEEIIRLKFIIVFFHNYVCDKTRFGQSRRPASSSLIRSLEKKMMMNSDEENCCAICLGDMAVGTQLNCMPCSHYFHIRCLWSWLERRGNCPICRYEMPAQSGANLE